jgi:hypothetical protein
MSRSRRDTPSLANRQPPFRLWQPELVFMVPKATFNDAALISPSCAESWTKLPGAYC